MQTSFDCVSFAAVRHNSGQSNSSALCSSNGRRRDRSTVVWAMVRSDWTQKPNVCRVLITAVRSTRFFGNAQFTFLGMALWGVGMGAQESIMKAAVAGIVPPERRGSAFGLFNAGYGIAWFIGSALMGVLYDTSINALISFSVGIQLAAIPVLGWVSRATRR